MVDFFTRGNFIEFIKDNREDYMVPKASALLKLNGNFSSVSWLISRVYYSWRKLISQVLEMEKTF